MRKTLLLSSLILASPLAAQDFTGKITMRTTDAGSGTAIDMTLYIDGEEQAIVMNAPAGPMAGREMRMVADYNAGKTTMFITMPGMPGGAKGVKMETPIPGDDGDATIVVKPLGTSQTIAGLKCDDYEVTTDGEVMNICGAESLGNFQMRGLGGMGRGSGAAWMKAFGDRPVFPLKVWNATGTAMEVTSITRGPVDPAMFDVNTPGYMQAPAMPGRRGN